MLVRNRKSRAIMVHIERIIYPVSVTAFLFGFGIFKHPLHSPRPLVSICYTLLIWSGYVYVFYYTVDLYTLKKVIPNYLHWFLIIINILMGTISVIVNIYHRKVQSLYSNGAQVQVQPYTRICTTIVRDWLNISFLNILCKCFALKCKRRNVLL